MKRYTRLSTRIQQKQEEEIEVSRKIAAVLVVNSDGNPANQYR
jgi:hypothetical protein